MTVASENPDRMLTVDDLHVSYGTARVRVKAVRGASFHIAKGEVLAVVGESGSGKSSLARAIMGMLPWDRGRMSLDGEQLAPMARGRPLAQRRRMAMVFQDSGSAFDPRFDIARILQEPLRLMGVDASAAKLRVEALLDEVRLPRALLDRRPHELSGGQRQRVGIARALASDPQLLVCDEPLSALDVSVQAQILNLLVDLQERVGLTFLFITHDIAVMQYLADRVVVMHMGAIVEQGRSKDVVDAPAHAYTRRLLSA